MSDLFIKIPEIPVSDLLLDINNFRLGSLDSQQSCIHAMLNDKQHREKLYNLAKDIAARGLYNRRIIVTKQTDAEAYVVRDGNRRITALKLLNNPYEAPENHRAFFASLARDALGFIPDKIDCECAVSEEIALNDMELSHMGEQSGVGQVTWGAVEKGNLDLQKGTRPRYSVARIVLEYMKSIGVADAHEIKITTLERFLSSRVREKIGLGWDGEKISFMQSETFTASILTEFFKDMISGTHNVRDIISVDLALGYVDSVLLKISVPSDTHTSQTEQTDTPAVVSAESEDLIDAAPVDMPPTKPEGTPSEAKPAKSKSAPRKSLTDRKHIVNRKTQHFPPGDEVKILNIIYELTRIDVHDTPLAGGVLLRLLLEFSVEYYLNKHSIPIQPNDALAKKASMAAEKLCENRLITNKEKNSLCSGANPLIDTNTMNAWVHDSNRKPDYKIVNTFFDNILPFLNLCWSK